MTAILLIATRKYKQFVQPLIGCIDNYIKQDKTIFIFTDEEINITTSSEVAQFIIEPYGFPEATLLRYEIFHRYRTILKNYTHLLYMDVDMRIVDDIGDEIIVDGLLAVRHCGFFKGGWGSANNPRESLSYLPPEQCYDYYCGGVQGGDSQSYLKACEILSGRIEDDRQRGVTAVYHDETHWNWLLKQDILPFTPLIPAYCMVEDVPRRIAWGISNFRPKIIALNKNHKEIRA